MTTNLPLPVIEKAALLALADACNYSVNAHVPKEAVTRRVPANLRGDVKKALRKLRSQGYCIEHPTRGNTTWQLTQNGMNVVRSISNGI